MNDETTVVNGTENRDEKAGHFEDTPTAGPGRAARRGRVGKIARLPLAVRQELNRRLRDGQPGRPLLDWLNGLPEVRAVLAAEFQGQPISKQNLSRWRLGGYQEAVADEQTRHEVKSLLEEIGGLREEAKEGLTEQLAFYLAIQTALELKRLQSVPHGDEKAKLWREMRTSVVSLRRGDIDGERLRLQREKYGLRHKTKEERQAEFWKWAEEDINRDEFCRRRCFTPEEREAAIDKILGLTPQQRGQPVPRPAAALPCETPAPAPAPLETEQHESGPHCGLRRPSNQDAAAPPVETDGTESDPVAPGHA